MNDLGQLSLYLVTGAMTAYLLSMIAFSIDASRGALDRARQSRSRAGARHRPTDGSAVTLVRTSDGSSASSSAPRRHPGRGERIGAATFLAGAVLLIAGTVTRGVAAGRVPWANMYEFTIVALSITSIAFLVLDRRYRIRSLGALVAGVTVVGLFLALAVLYLDADSVQPALQSYWLVVHVSVATAATGLFALGCIVSVLQLVARRRESRAHEAPTKAGMDAIRLEEIAFRLNAVGFVLWTFTLIAGAIWAEHAWGRYWGWDAKEVATLVVWVIYAAYLHARLTRGWEGSRAAWFSIAGFVAVLLNFYGVNLFAFSLHGYSGV